AIVVNEPVPAAAPEPWEQELRARILALRGDAHPGFTGQAGREAFDDAPALRRGDGRRGPAREPALDQLSRSPPGGGADGLAGRDPRSDRPARHGPAAPPLPHDRLDQPPARLSATSRRAAPRAPPRRSRGRPRAYAAPAAPRTSGRLA